MLPKSESSLKMGPFAFLLQLSDTSVLGVENIRKHEKQTVDSDPTDPLLNL